MKDLRFLFAPGIVFFLLLVSNNAFSYVDPDFTPHRVYEESKIMCTVTVKNIAGDGKSAEMKTCDVIKGEFAEKAVKIDFTKVLAKEEGGAMVKYMIELLKASGNNPAFFAYGGPEGEEFALLHVSCAWVRLEKGGDYANWVLLRPDPVLNGTFNGSTDMLIATMRFIKKFPDIPVMPITVGVEWVSHNKIGTMPGTATGIQLVDINADGKPGIFVSCLKGDRTFVRGKEGFEETKMTLSGSLRSAWADFDGNGRPDLASLGTASLTLVLQDPAGTFKPRQIHLTQKITTDNPTIHVIDLKADGIPDLVVGAKKPLVLLNNGKAGFQEIKLPEAPGGNERGKPGPCAACDFDNDGYHDIVQVFQNSSIFYKGLPNGDFRAGVVSECGMGRVDVRRHYIADFNCDGLLDIFLVGGNRTPHLLENTGGTFREAMKYTGEPSYVIQAGATCAAAGDYNNDTFVDILAGYPESRTQFFFNRGFRCFVICKFLQLNDEDIEGCSDGLACAVWADADRDGAREMISAFSNNDVYVSKTDLGDGYDPLSISVSLDRKARLAGQLNVRFYMEGHCLGVRTADIWGEPAVLGITEPGEYEIEYQFPGRKKVRKKVVAEEGKKQIVVNEKSL